MSSDNFSDCGLLVFVKDPQPGEVKTRLAEHMGETKALRVYRKLLEYTEAIIAQLPVETYVYYGNTKPDQDIWSQSSGVQHRSTQQGKDLGARMRAAFRDLFQAGKQRVVIIGSDCAELQLTHLEEAFRSLNDNDAVIGPANDGGYYLLGLNRMVPELFQDMDWSTEHVYKTTIQRLKERNLRWYTLQVLTDMDNYEDWKKTGYRLL
jgi:rSAM/selenodomain-associated transferase 1